MKPTIHDVTRRLEAHKAACASLDYRISALEAGTSSSEAGQAAEKRRAAEQLAMLREYEAELDKLLNSGVLLSDATARLRKEPRFEKFLRAEAAQSYAR